MTIDAIVDALEPRATRKGVTSSRNWLVSVAGVEVLSNLVRPRYSLVVHVSPTKGEDELLKQTLDAIAALRRMAVVQGAVRIAPDKKYDRMEIQFGGVSV